MDSHACLKISKITLLTRLIYFLIEYNHTFEMSYGHFSMFCWIKFSIPMAQFFCVYTYR